MRSRLRFLWVPFLSGSGPGTLCCLLSASPSLARIWSKSRKERGPPAPLGMRSSSISGHPGLPSTKILWLACLMGISLPGCLLLVIFWLLTTSLCFFAVNPQLSLLHSELNFISLLFCNSSEKSLSYHFNKHQSNFFFLNFTHQKPLKWLWIISRTSGPTSPSVENHRELTLRGSASLDRNPGAPFTPLGSGFHCWEALPPCQAQSLSSLLLIDLNSAFL